MKWTKRYNARAQPLFCYLNHFFFSPRPRCRCRRGFVNSLLYASRIRDLSLSNHKPVISLITALDSPQL